MAPPLKVKRIAAPKAKYAGCLFIALASAGAAALGYLFFKGKPLAFFNPATNFLAHALLVAIPALGVYSNLAVPMEFETPEGETLVEDASYLRSLKTDWWMSLMLWPSLVLGAGFAAYFSFSLFTGQDRVWSTSPLSALLTSLLALGLFFFFGNVIRLKAPFYVSEEGMRLGASFFLEWGKIDHLQEKQGVFFVYLKHNTFLPIASVRPVDTNALEALLSMLSKKEIRGTEYSAPILASIKVGLLAVFSGMIGLGLFLWNKEGWDPRWVITCLFSLGVLLSLALERLRGVHKLTRIKPRLSAGLQDAGMTAQRALCLAALVTRGKLEAELKKSQARGNESVHKEIHRLEEWMAEQSLAIHLSDTETVLMRRPGGTWTLQEANLACWRNEALGILLWAIGFQEKILPYDHPYDWEEISQTLPMFSPISGFLDKACRRPEEDILRAREVAELWHWRARTTHIMAQGVEAPRGVTFEEVIEQAAYAAFDQHDIPQPLGKDFPVFNKAYGSLNIEEYQLAASIAAERHLALNWLCAYARDWDDTPTDT
ncbi:MAG: DUF4272 domain-containing protein [Desulfatibacillum sp.]|nr:DUF4272 domain-containing protein [Desulfatibacillum sp.]